MKRTSIVIALFAALALSGCDKKPTPPSGTSAEKAPPGDPSSPAHAVLGTYEEMRVKLAADQSGGLADLAGRFADQAKAAAEKSSGDAKKALEGAAAAAADLKGKAGDLGEARKAFGEVSRHVVALLVAEPKLREGRYVFECPMAEGYKKWVQTKTGIENPYMGKKMLECGEKSDFKT